MQPLRTHGLKLHRGVYCGVNGPQFETPAENPHVPHARCGCGRHVHRVPRSLQPRTAVALVGIAMITNMAAGVFMQPLSPGAEVNETAERRGAELRRLVAKLLEKILRKISKGVLTEKRFLRYTNKAVTEKRWQLDFEVWLSW